MLAIAGFSLVLSFGCFIVGLFMLLPRRSREKGKAVLGTSVLLFILCIVFIGFSGHPDDDAAKVAGFSGGAAYRQAMDAGIKTPDEWKAHQDREIAKAEEERKAKATLEAKEAEEAEQKCLADLQCVDKRLSNEAVVQCSDPIEKLAKYSHEWEGWMIGRFSHLRWKNKKKGIVTMIGDKIKFQNGFGAWQYMTYECDMDVKGKTALDVRVHAGRLP